MLAITSQTVPKPGQRVLQAFLCRGGIRTMGYTPEERRRTCHAILSPLHWAVHETILVISIPHVQGQVPAPNTRLIPPAEAQQPPPSHLTGPRLNQLCISQLTMWSQHPSHPSSPCLYVKVRQEFFPSIIRCQSKKDNLHRKFQPKWLKIWLRNTWMEKKKKNLMNMKHITDIPVTVHQPCLRDECHIHKTSLFSSFVSWFWISERLLK